MAKLQIYRTAFFEEADAATLEATVNAFLAAESRREFIDIQYQVAFYDGTAVHAAMVVYTE